MRAKPVKFEHWRNTIEKWVKIYENPYREEEYASMYLVNSRCGLCDNNESESHPIGCQVCVGRFE